jgi:hypothetical protein
VTKATMATLLIAAALGAAGCGGSSKKSESTQAKPATTATTTTSGRGSIADRIGAKAQLQTAGNKFNVGQRRFLKQVIQDANARNFQAIKADVSQFRDVIFNFDAEIRKIKFPPAFQTDVNAMLEGDRTSIAELDAMGATKGFVDFLPLFKRFNRDKKTTIAAINKVIHEL